MIAEKTGWTPQQISHINLDALRILVEAWEKIAKEQNSEGEGKKSTVKDVKEIQNILSGVK